MKATNYLGCASCILILIGVLIIVALIVGGLSPGGSRKPMGAVYVVDFGIDTKINLGSVSGVITEIIIRKDSISYIVMDGEMKYELHLPRTEDTN